MNEPLKFGVLWSANEATNYRLSEATHQIMRRHAQCFSNFHERIHRRRLPTAFDATDKNCRKPRLFSQLFLTEFNLLPFQSNGFTQEATMLRVSRHGQLRDRKRPKSAMSLTTDYACDHLLDILKETQFRRRI